MKSQELSSIFSAIEKLRIGVLGDFALDFYYQLSIDTGESSIETGKEVFHGSHPRPVPGGAGTIVNNLKALGIQDIHCFGLTGKDLFGRELRHQLRKRGANLAGLIEVDEAWDTYVYAKPLIKEVEGNRIDFGSRNPIHSDDFQIIYTRLEEQLPNLDVLIINQQFKDGITAPKRLKVFKKLLQQSPACFVISDLRDSTGALEYGLIKGNLSEISRMSGLEDKVKGIDPMEIVKKVQQESQCPVLMTLGEAGMLYRDQEQEHRVQGIPLQGPLDITGAGDACLAAFSACMGIKTSVPVAIYIANLAAAISVQKLRETGSASPAEILAMASSHPFS